MISPRLLRWWWMMALVLGLGTTACAEPLNLSTRSRIRSVRNTNDWGIHHATAQWESTRTAVVVCDMWDKHHCPDATERVGEMAPRMNEMIKAARARGCLIIHCPSDTMDFYKDHPGRKLAQSAPKVATTIPLEGWCSLKPDVEAPLPIDDSDGGCDGCPDCPSFKAWSRQHPALEILPGDAITDSAEAFYLMRQRGITNVIVMGVHINMCVLGRPFSIRQMIRQGQNVVLVRDMTDSMYNHRKRPFVSHFRGTELVVEHIEKYWCPSITSSEFIPGPNFRFKADQPKRVTFVIGENEYRTWETLPVFTRNHLSIRGYRFAVVSASPKDGDGDFKNWEAIRNSDLLILSVRRRTAPPGMIQALRDHVAAGKPIVGIRTASHAFEIRGQTNTTPQTWPNFDDEILGADYQDHYGKGPGKETLVSVVPEATGHPVLTGIPATARFTSHLYRNRNLFRTVTPLLRGQTEDGKSEVEPVAWVNTRDNRRVFYTSLGSPEDFADPTFQRLLLNGILWALDEFIPPAAAPIVDYAGGWQRLKVPGTWDETSRNRLAAFDGFAWYRAWVKIPADWPTQAELFVEQVDDAHEAYLDGVRVGAAGAFPPAYQSGLGSGTAYPITLRPGQSVLVALRIFDNGGRGGFKGRAPEIRAGNRTLPLTGEWEFRTGDNPEWSKPANPPSKADFDGTKAAGSISPATAPAATAPAATPPPQLAPLPPAEAARRFEVAPDLAWDQVLAEPDIAQPVFLTFDERGRMWVVEYRQYPHPAGLKMVSRDNFWRAVYDKVPPPPPNHFPGADRISIHEDSDGNGTYDRHSIFVDGLNIATSVAFDRGGVWVLNPPYLLFYPDANHDDKPDGDPEVRLSGFGLEDTHSVANSLRWGPDGWLYGCQGSTVTGNILVHSTDGRPLNAKPIYSQGQNIWRYHPERRVYEVFSEGGGNAFGLEFDSAGRVFSGHNGGNTRGFHYQQGAYLQKGFDKHGPLSNPHAYGYFPAIPHPDVDRFTHNFVLYDSGTLGEAYQGRLFGVEPLQGRIVLSEITRDGSTFRTRDLGHPVRSTDAFFRPVDIKLGPDGALYVCDWYDRQVNHYRNHEGQMDASNGRIYRLRHKDALPGRAVVPGKNPAPATLLAHLTHSNRFVRQEALRLLASADKGAVQKALDALLRTQPGAAGPDLALEGLWAAHRVGLLDDALAARTLRHPNPQVRLWTARLKGDVRPMSPGIAAAIAEQAAIEPDVEARSQYASTARRLPAAQAMAVVKALLTHDRDAGDPRQPLMLWWAIEQHCESDRQAVLGLFSDAELWRSPIVQNHLLHRLARRFAASGRRDDLLALATFFQRSPGPTQTTRLTQGFEEASQGRPLAGLPTELVEAMEKAGSNSLLIGVRRSNAASIQQAIQRIQDEKTEVARRLQLVQVLGETRQEAALPALLALVRDSKSSDLRRAALGALQSFDQPVVGSDIVAAFPSLPSDVRTAALGTLTTRPAWALQLLRAIESSSIPVAAIPTDVARRLKGLPGEEAGRLTGRLWPRLGQPAPAELEKEIQRLAGVIDVATGNPYPGKKLFIDRCAGCHRLFNRGGEIGPDLTTYQRTDLANLLLNIVNPGAEIREGYQGMMAETRDGRLLNGFITDQDPSRVVLRTLDGQTVPIDSKDLASLAPSPSSLMPEGLLTDLSDQQVRDLFAYLRSTQPLND